MTGQRTAETGRLTDAARQVLDVVAKVTPYAKAVAGGVAGLSTALGQAGLDGQVTSAEWYGAVVAGMVAAGAVWAVPNRATRSGTASGSDSGP